MPTRIAQTTVAAPQPIRLPTPAEQDKARGTPNPSSSADAKKTRDEQAVAGSGGDRPAVENPKSAPRDDTVDVHPNSDALQAGARLQSAGQRIALAQDATTALGRGRAALARLDEVAAQAVAKSGDPELTRSATELSARIETADRDPSLQSVRLAIDQATAEQDTTDAENEAARLQEAAKRAAQAAQRQPTLVLTPRVEDPGQAERRANVAETEAQSARRAVEQTSVARILLDPARETELPPALRPEEVDLSTPEAAGRTRAAIQDAVKRGSRLEEQVGLFGQRAEQDARLAMGTTRGKTELTGRPGARLQSERQAQNTAREVAQTTIDNPAQALATQPYISVEAALRVLS